MSRFWGSPTSVASPPSAVPTAACIIMFRRKALKRSRSPRMGSFTSSSSAWSCSSSDAAIRGEAVVDRVEPRRDGDDDRDHRERVEEGREQRRRADEGEREQELRAHRDQQLREHHQQQVTQEVDARDHEDQQQDDREVRHRLVVDALGAGQADDDTLERDEATRLERVALQRHGEGEDELGHEHPPGDDRAERDEQERIEHQERDDRRLVPIGRVTQEVARHGVPVPADQRPTSRPCRLPVVAPSEISARTRRRRRHARRAAGTGASGS